jgi:hypothetical protein
MNEAKNIQKVKTKAWSIAIVISRFFLELAESIKVVTVIFTFTFLFFFGLIIAPLAAFIKWLWRVWGKYYNWLGDWAISNGL